MTVTETHTSTLGVRKETSFSWGSAATETVVFHVTYPVNEKGHRNGPGRVVKITSTVRVYHGTSLTPAHTQESRITGPDIADTYEGDAVSDVLPAFTQWGYSRDY